MIPVPSSWVGEENRVGVLGGVWGKVGQGFGQTETNVRPFRRLDLCTSVCTYLILTTLALVCSLSPHRRIRTHSDSQNNSSWEAHIAIKVNLQTDKSHYPSPPTSVADHLNTVRPVAFHNIRKVDMAAATKPDRTCDIGEREDKNTVTQHTNDHPRQEPQKVVPAEKGLSRNRPVCSGIPALQLHSVSKSVVLR